MTIIGNANGPLKVSNSRFNATVNGKVQQLICHPVIQFIPVERLPEVPQVDALSTLPRQFFDVDVGIGTFGDAPLGLTTGVGWIIDIAPFVPENSIYGIVEGHVTTYSP